MIPTGNSACPVWCRCSRFHTGQSWRRAPIIPGYGIDDSAHVLEHAQDTPKAPTGEDERFRVGALWCLIEERGRQALIDVSALGDGAHRRDSPDKSARTAATEAAETGHSLLAFHMTSSLHYSDGFEGERHAIHAVAQTGRTRAVGKHMAEVPAAADAVNFRSIHQEACVTALRNCVRQQLPEARPSRVGCRISFPHEKESGRLHPAQPYVPVRVSRSSLLENGTSVPCRRCGIRRLLG